MLLANLLIVVPGGIAQLVAADEGTPASEVTVEPTAEVTEEPAPVETVLPTDVPEPTVRPVNTDTMVPDADFSGVVLQSGIDASTTVSFVYQVTTPRLGTRLVVELRDSSGAPARGWTLSIPSLGLDGAGTVSGLESSTLNAGESFSLAITISPPTDVTVAETVSLHIWSTGVLDGGSEEAAVADTGALATITILPPTPTPTETPTVAPTTPATPAAAPSTPVTQQVITDEFTGAAVVNGGDITCTPNGTSTVTISTVQYFAASFACTDSIPVVPGSATYSASTASPWLVRFNSDTPAATPTATLSGLLGAVSFTLTLLTPTTSANGTTGSATVRQGTNAPTTISSTKSTIQNGGASGLYNFECADPAPVNQTIAQGGSISFTCTFWGLATADVATLVTLKPTLKMTAPGGVGSFLVGGQPYASGVSINVADLISANVITSTSIPITYLAPCNVATGLASIGVRSTLDLTVLIIPLPLATFDSTVPVTVNGATLVAPSVSLSAVNFGASEWNGTSYPAKTGSMALTMSPPAGCGMTTWKVTASVTTPMTSGSHTIPASAISYTGTTGNFGPGMSTGTAGNLGASATVLNGSQVVAGSAALSLNLSLQPPPNAPPGTYTGTITVTSSSGP